MNKCKLMIFFRNIDRHVKETIWIILDFFIYKWYKLIEKKLGYNLGDWRVLHDPQFLFEMEGDYNYPIYVGVWRDFKDLKPYFVVAKKMFKSDCKIARIDFKSGEILPDKNIFRRLKLSENDIQNVYEVLNHNLAYGGLILWDEIRYYWNDQVYEHLGYINRKSYFVGKCDKKRRNNKWYIPSDTPIPDIHYKK